jgi:hypothetical protein
VRTYYFYCYNADGRRVEDALSAEDDDEFRAKLPIRLSEQSRFLDTKALILRHEWGILDL